MRLIDADDVSALFDAEYKETRELIKQGETHLDNLAEGFTEAYRVVQKMPTVDAVPVVHGRWIKDGDVVVCSECGEEHAWEEYRATYCEDCGAKMYGGNEDG